MSHQQEEKLAKDEGDGELNPKIGFKCLHYSVVESSGSIKITLIKKCDEAMTFGVRTKDDTAKVVEDYNALDKQIMMKAEEKEFVIEVEIVDDEQWQPDRDFLVELYDVTSSEKLHGIDTQTRITIIDDDQPGVLSFNDKNIKGHAKDKFVSIRVLRKDGADGVSLSFNNILDS
jgi:solute carrier family 8 (sodium/calcium exchanger)